MANVIEVVEVEVDGQVIQVERLEDGTFRRPAYLEEAKRKVVKEGRGFDPNKNREGQFDSIRASNVGVNTAAFNARIGEVTEPATPEAKAWEGWGTQLKPAVEIWWLCRKPLAEPSVVAQVVKTSTGALNLDGCRIGTGKDKGIWPVTDRSGRISSNAAVYQSFNTSVSTDVSKGRWPSNVVFSHVQYVWYTLRQDVPKEFVQAVHAYYGVDEALRTGRLPGEDSWDAFGSSETKVLLEGVLRLVPACVSQEEGTVSAPRREPRLEVTLEAIPEGWRTYFVEAAVGGCRKVGTREVPAPTINRFTDGAKPFGGGAGHPYESSGGGTEELDVYECVPGCPVAALDEPIKKGGDVRSGANGPSRFFQVFKPDYEVPFFYTGKASRKDKNADLEEEGLINKHPCLHPAALVMGEAGYRPIQTLQIGDKVLSADGHFHAVELVSQHPYTSENLVEIRVAGTNLTTLASDNHPFLIWRPTRKGTVIVGHKIQWLRADQIEVGDYTMTSLVRRASSEAPLPENLDFWFLVGLYLAKGCPHSGGYASFSLHEDEVDLVQRIRMYSEPSKIGVYPKKGSDGEATMGVQVVLFDRDLGAWCGRLCDKGARGKSMDPCIWGLPEESQRAFLEGYLAGDGRPVRTYIQVKTVSPDIASQIRFLAEKLGYKVELQLCPAEEGGVGSRPSKSTNSTYVLRLSLQNCLEGRRPTQPTCCEYEGAMFTLSYVKSVNRVPYQGDVINLSVEGSPTFQTAVGMSHNTVKSQALMTYLVRLVTPPGGLVLDPFAGSGSTLVAAVTEGFRFIGIEREPDFHKIATIRTEKALARVEVERQQRAAFEAMAELPQD